MPWLEYMQVFDITYVSDGSESIIILNCKMPVMVVAGKLYMNP
jgi:hypothetical protein